MKNFLIGMVTIFIASTSLVLADTNELILLCQGKSASRTNVVDKNNTEISLGEVRTDEAIISATIKENSGKFDGLSSSTALTCNIYENQIICKINYKLKNKTDEYLLEKTKVDINRITGFTTVEQWIHLPRGDQEYAYKSYYSFQGVCEKALKKY